MRDQLRLLSAPARTTFELSQVENRLALADISYRETAMLLARGRLNPSGAAIPFAYLGYPVDGYGLVILPIMPEISAVSQSGQFSHGDPEDRGIAATAVLDTAPLMAADERL
jgi:PIN domain nuclease of toxin-antitoxin system